MSIRSILRKLSLAIGAAFLVGLAAMSQADAAAPFQAQIEAAQQKVNAEKGVFIDFTLKNVSTGKLHVLSWHTPLEGLWEDLFDVRRNGKPVDYVGPMVKRGQPTPDAYFALEPGETRKIRLDLSEGYDFSQTGEYSVQYAGGIADYDESQPNPQSWYPRLKPAIGKLATAKVTISVVSGKPKMTPVPTVKATEENADPTFSKCSADQQAQIKRAFSGAQWLAQTAKQALMTTPMEVCQGARRYVTWFGSYDQGRVDGLRVDFEKLSNALNEQIFNFDCGCTDNYYAYVYPNKPYNVYLCKAYWGAPMVGTDSKAGTIVHETSHFTVVAGTKDYAYGQAKAQQLAKDSPGKAVKNADSFEYFSEDTPPIAMP